MLRALLIAVLAIARTPAAAPSARDADAALDRALRELVAMPGGPPSVIALMQRGGSRRVHTAGIRWPCSKRCAPQRSARCAPRWRAEWR